MCWRGSPRGLYPSVFDNTVLLKKFAGEEGEGVDVQKLFGYIGLFTLVALWWLGILILSIFNFTSVSSET